MIESVTAAAGLQEISITMAISLFLTAADAFEPLNPTVLAKLAGIAKRKLRG
jgi:hypothetical protein